MSLFSEFRDKLKVKTEDKKQGNIHMRILIYEKIEKQENQNYIQKKLFHQVKKNQEDGQQLDIEKEMQMLEI